MGHNPLLHPADDLQATLFARGEHFGKDIKAPVVRRTSVFDNRVFIVLRMRGGEVPAMIIEVVLLLAMVGQRLAWNLSSGDPSTIGEYRKKQGIHAGALLKHVQNLLRAFIHK